VSRKDKSDQHQKTTKHHWTEDDAKSKVERTKPKRTKAVTKTTTKIDVVKTAERDVPPTLSKTHSVKNEPQTCTDSIEENSDLHVDEELVDLFHASASILDVPENVKRARRQMSVNVPVSITPVEPQVQSGIYRVVQFYDTVAHKRWIPVQCQYVW